MNLFGTLRKKWEETREETLGRYYAFLSSVDLSKPTDAEATDLQSMLDVLGFTIERAEADHAKIVEAKANLAAVAQLSELSKQVDETNARLQEAFAERIRQNQRCNAEIANASSDHDTAFAARDRGYAARRALEQLQESDAAIYAVVMESASAGRRRR